MGEDGRIVIRACYRQGCYLKEPEENIIQQRVLQEVSNTYEMAQSCIRPEYALGCNPFAGLAHIHTDYSTEKVFDLFRVVVESQPSRPSKAHAPHHKSGKMDERNTVEAGGEQTADVLFITNEKDPSNYFFE